MGEEAAALDTPGAFEVASARSEVTVTAAASSVVSTVPA
jgi:hypothetical protein